MNAPPARLYRRKKPLAVAAVIVTLALVGLAIVMKDEPPALQLVVDDIRDGTGGTWGAVFPEGSAKAAGYLKRADSASAEDDVQLFSDAMNDGAYGLGGITVSVIATTTSRLAIIKNIRPVLVRKDVASGALFYTGTQGDIPRFIGFQLDALNPVAKVWNPKTRKLGDDFFHVQRLAILSTGDGETLVLNFQAEEAAYEFTVAIDYVVEGRRYTQYLLQDGKKKVFRATGPRCNKPGITRPYETLRWTDFELSPRAYKPVTAAAFCAGQR
ncbi:hypothetical protein ABT010_39585 [Streptomyces sp. NPDC002668]|uniref:hypothetical protein n=1 Tax=Streptomyces sp. NPDC002668 TaxID=3154422 RepID=UPI00331AB95D